MQPRRLLLLALVVGSVTVAGCLGDAGPAPVSGGDGADGGGGGGGGGGGDGAPGDGADGNITRDATWDNTTASGTILLSANAVVAATTPAGGNTATFQVDDGTLELSLVLNTSGGPTGADLQMLIADPECDPGPMVDCEEAETTSGGQATFEAAEPMEGEWSIRIFAGDPVAIQADWELTVGRLVPAA